MPPRSPARSVVATGARAATALAVAVVPFGLVYGVAVTESTVSTLVGLSASWIILAGAAQLSLLSLIDGGAAWPLAVGTALVINARLALYSTALAPPFAAFPARWRYGLPYMLTDQAASMALLHYRSEHDADRRRWWFLGAAGIIVVAPAVFSRREDREADEITAEQKTSLGALHLRKIDLADRVLVVNPGGYIGESTSREIAYAHATGKPVSFADPC